MEPSTAAGHVRIITACLSPAVIQSVIYPDGVSRDFTLMSCLISDIVITDRFIAFVTYLLTQTLTLPLFSNRCHGHNHWGSEGPEP